MSRVINNLSALVFVFGPTIVVLNNNVVGRSCVVSRVSGHVRSGSVEDFGAIRVGGTVLGGHTKVLKTTCLTGGGFSGLPGGWGAFPGRNISISTVYSGQ